MKSRVFAKLLAGFLAVIALSTITLDFFVYRSWERSLRKEKQESLQARALLLADRLALAGTTQLASLPPGLEGTRLTIVDRVGVVLTDTAQDPRQMEAHDERPEIAAALAGRSGHHVRLSATTGIEYLYVAVPFRDGALRLAEPLSSVRATMDEARSALLRATVFSVLIAVLVAYLLAQSMARRLRRIVEFADRVAAGDLSARVAEKATDEIAQLAAALDKTARQLERSFRTVEESRQQLETLLNSIQDPVVAVDAAGHVQWANRHMAALAPAGVRIGAPAVETVRDPEVLRVLRATLDQRSVQQGRAFVSRPSHAYAVNAAPLPGGGAVAVLHDLTGVERVEKTRRDFIANVSHELRTPLTSIRGYAEALLDSESDAASTREFLEIIRKNAERMSRLTEDLLALARVESGEMRFVRTPVSPSELITAACESFAKLAASRGMAIETDCAATREVMADADAIHQVFSNLIENAVKYAADGKRLIVGATDVAEPGGGVEFYVRDCGPGIASEHLPRVFERFYRVDAARSRESGGTGLGLAIAKHIMLAHGGSLWAESALHHGSTFRFRLPAASCGE